MSEFDGKVVQTSEYFLKDIYSLTEEVYMDYKTELKERLSKFRTTSDVKKSCSDSSCDGNQRGVQLPKITIPNFSGDYSEWATFRDLFVALIHNNESLLNVQKLHYLKSYLTGEAEQLLRHLAITNENYTTCWNILERRYNNKRFITNCIFKRFFSQKNITFESAKAIKELLDTTNECLNALVNIGINVENWDIIVIYILSLKLDTESRKQWEAKACSFTDELPTLKQFLEFLEHRFRSLEFLGTKVVKGSQSHHVSTSFDNNQSISCIYCSGTDHKLGNCNDFSKTDLTTRRNFVQSTRLCFNCLGKNHLVSSCRLPTRCRYCKGKHHSQIHGSNLSTQNPGVNNQSVDSNDIGTNSTTEQGETTIENITTCCSNTKSQVLLATALLKAETNTGSTMTLRALVDQGSQASFITESAVRLLGLKKVKANSVITGVGNASLDSKYVVYLKLQSLQDPTFTIRVKAHVLNKLTSFIPDRKFVAHLWPNLPKMKLADPDFNIPSKIDTLLGADVYCHILVEGLIRGPPGTPIAQNTKLGWILSGQVSEESETRDTLNCYTTIIAMHAQNNDEEFNLKKFWELESDNFTLSKNHRTVEEQRCEDFFQETTTRDSEGRYIVQLPFKEEDPSCKYGNSREIAITRFLMLEKRLLKSPNLKTQYSDVISEYLTLGHMEVIHPEQIDKPGSVYLPHHAVIRADKTTSKVRVVFDASCRDNNGASLNNDLMVGPTLQAELRHIIMKWRIHPICMVADIVKMYRQIRVADEAIDFQRLVWRTRTDEDLQHLRLTRVTFGTASAPYLAVRSLHQTAYDEGKDFPMATEKILKDFYMDDLLTGCQSVAEGKQLFVEISKILNKGGFELQKWSSNNDELLDEINQGNKSTKNNLTLKTDETIKILGLTWNRRTDDFKYSVQLPAVNKPVTKRKVVSDIAKLFDPMGWIAPAIVKAKIMIQRLWLAGIGWDEELPPNLLKDWINYRNELTALTGFKIPRWIGVNDKNTMMELHGFSDASNEAYAAVVYARIVDEAGHIYVYLITSKTKVAPIKQVSIPRLELCGAVLAAKLLQEVSEVLKVPKEKLHAWTDSTVVLAWLSSHPSRWKTFIANRVSEILTILDREQWSHVSTKDNPADCASRGVNPSVLELIQLWKTGPALLRKSTIDYHQGQIGDTDLEERKMKVCHLRETNQFELWNKFSTLRKLIRVLAYCRRFLARSRKTKTNETTSWLTSGELNEALHICVKQCQNDNFLQEINDIKQHGTVNRKSKLTSLNPFLDTTDTLRVGGRLERASVTNDMKHPVILPAKSHLTDLVIAEAHEKTLHGGPQSMLNYLRSKYWIEACLNSRPLSQISDSSQDPIPLTPAHFLIGEPVMLVPEYNYENSNISSLKRWQLTQKMLQEFWRRWSQEYLNQFLHRYKWATKIPEPNIGDIVLVKEDDLPPARWLLGIVTAKHTGLDNITRVVSLKCRGVIIKRPVAKLCVLPVNTDKG
ncbi:uncharacterized protein [Maniola hyperantus]|uniref:uncharacterized protein n=1 Tax=Aphantopus hyperantus TaxID=2795564 RepID=UPI0037486B88